MYNCICIQEDLFNFDPHAHPVQYRNEKRLTSQRKSLLDVECSGTATLVGSFAFFHFGTDGGPLKNHTVLDLQLLVKKPVLMAVDV